jgi:short-subunit dehydrogenase
MKPPSSNLNVTFASVSSFGARGTLLFTGATASLRGNTTTSAFSAGKFGLRALSQSLSKEFGKDNIHVAHAVIDGRILTGRAKEYQNVEDPDKFIGPDGIAEVG